MSVAMWWASALIVFLLPAVAEGQFLWGGDRFNYTHEHSAGMCAMFGSLPCGFTTTQKCRAVNSIPPADITQTWSNSSIANFDTLCPGLHGERHLCCSEQDFMEMKNRLTPLPLFISTCPACLRNTIDMWCRLSCSPDQSQFVNIVHTSRPFGRADGTPYNASVDRIVADIDYYITEEYARAYWDTCKDASLSQSASLFIAPLLCQCVNPSEPYAFVNGQGALSPYFGSPFAIRFPKVGPRASTLLADGDDGNGDGDGDGRVSAPTIQLPDGIVPVSADDVKHCTTLGFRCPPSQCSAAIVGRGGDVAGDSIEQVTLAYFRAEADSEDLDEQVSEPLLIATIVLSALCGVVGLVCIVIVFWRRRRRGKSSGHEGQNGSGPKGQNGEPKYSTSAPGPNGLAMLTKSASVGLLNGDLGVSDPTGARGHAASTNGDDGACSGGGGGGGGDHDEDDDNDDDRAGNSGDTIPPVSQVPDHWFHRRMHQAFFRVAEVVLGHPVPVFLVATIIFVAMSAGVYRLEIESDPIELWVAKDGKALEHKNIYDENFGPFYRIEHVVMSQKNIDGDVTWTDGGRGGGANAAQILNDDALLALFEVQNRIFNLTASYELADGRFENVTLRDICFKIGGETFSGATIPPSCVSQSVLEFYQNDVSTFASRGGVDHVRHCMSSWATSECYSSYEAPMADLNIYLGGYEGDSYENATALILTYLVINHVDDVLNEPAIAWERAFVHLLAELRAAYPQYELAFSTEHSLDDELSRQTHNNVSTTIISYVVMWVYIAFALGQYSRGGGWRRWIVESRVLLSFGSIVLVCCSVLMAVGVFSWSTKISYIVAELLPVISLAISVDDIFIYSDAAQREIRHVVLVCEKRGVRVRRRMIRDAVVHAVAHVGPSMMIAGLSETFAFALGSVAAVPAVRTFAQFATVAIFVNSLMQITCFPPILYWDATRVHQRRVDCVPCVVMPVRSPPPPPPPRAAAGSNSGDETLKGPGDAIQLEVRGLPATTAQPVAVSMVGDTGEKGGGGGGGGGGRSASVASVVVDTEVDESRLDGLRQRWARNYYVPWLLHPYTKVCVVVSFTVLFLVCLWLACTQMVLGLDERDAVPDGSYLIDYFTSLETFLAVGPPAYMVVMPANFSAVPTQDLACSVLAGCSNNSLVAVLNALHTDPALTYVATKTNSWIDDFLTWASPDGGLNRCCRVRKNDTAAFCSPDEDDDNEICQPCLSQDFTDNSRVPAPQFARLLQQFSKSQSSASHCPVSGAAAYQLSINVRETDGGVVAASSFRIQHTVLKEQDDFITAYRRSLQTAELLERNSGGALTVFPYSSYYVYFEQYLDIVETTFISVGASVLAIFLFHLLFMGDARSSALVAVTVLMVTVDVAGVMTQWEVFLNGLSLANLIMATGIACEFTSHCASEFIRSNGRTSNERAAESLIYMGSSVFSGITVTKLLGISVIAFAESQIFVVYYFRVLLLLVIFGATHGLVFLPVVQTLIVPDRAEASSGEASTATTADATVGAESVLLEDLEQVEVKVTTRDSVI